VTRTWRPQISSCSLRSYHSLGGRSPLWEHRRWAHNPLLGSRLVLSRVACGIREGAPGSATGTAASWLLGRRRRMAEADDLGLWDLDVGRQIRYWASAAAASRRMSRCSALPACCSIGSGTDPRRKLTCPTCVAGGGMSDRRRPSPISLASCMDIGPGARLLRIPACLS